MEVAPYDACTRCFKGDTATGFFASGVAEWAIAALESFGGCPREVAVVEVDQMFEDQLGCERGAVQLGYDRDTVLPEGRIEFSVRLCRECAQRTGAAVGPLSGRLPGYIQPPGDEEDS